MYKTYNCVVCNTESRFKHSKSNLYCSLACQQAKRTQDLIENWLSGGDKSVWKYSIPAWAKKYLIDIRGHKCVMCNHKTWLGEPIPLEVDHIDGDHQNNQPNNLRLLCPTCHSMTDTYKNRNYGKGRKTRVK
jgi:5-methylcytosine-specific restriction endonuclease McrA